MLYFNFLLSFFKNFVLFFNLYNSLFKLYIVSEDSPLAFSKYCILFINSFVLILSSLIVLFKSFKKTLLKATLSSLSSLSYFLLFISSNKELITS